MLPADRLESRESPSHCNTAERWLETATMTSLKHPVLMAVIGAAHGIKGEVRLNTFTGDPMALANYGSLRARDGRTFEVLDLRPQGNVVVARLEGIGDRNAAEALNGIELFVERTALPDELDEEEFYHADLIGMDVLDEHSTKLGKVSAIQNYEAGDILEVKGPGIDGTLIPFTRAAVPAVDVAARVIRIDSVAAGLAEDGADQPEAGAEQGGFDPARRPRGPRDAGGNR
jgi:16S rRNA processing protein RimM